MSVRADHCADCGAAKPTPRHTYCETCSAARRRRSTRPKAASTKARGYDARHRRERAKWEPKVERGEVDCHAITCLHKTRRIKPGSRWDLGHTPDRSAWTGPEHERCNRSDGATRGNQQRQDTPQPVTPTHNTASRDW